MPKSAKRTVSAKAPVTPATPKAGKRNISVSGKPDKAALKASAAQPAPVTDAAVPMPRGLTRDAAGIVRAATNFAQYSDRDSAYLAFFGTVCRANGGKATLRQIHDSGITRSGHPDRKHFNPNYTGSAKATDVGAINRLIADGYFSRSADGNTITALAKATDNAIYRGTKA